RAPMLSDPVMGPLSFAECGGSDLYELSMGLPAFGSRLSQHFSGAVPGLPIAALSKSPLSLGTFSPPLATLPTDVHVRCGKADQRRRFLVEPYGTPLSLRDSAIA